MTMQELADLAGVSVSTVSKAFSGSREISDGVREKIFKLAKQNNCYFKYIKSSKYKYVIGVVCPEFQSGHYTQHLDYFEREIKKRGGVMLAAGENFDKTERRDLVLYFSGKLKADGIILYSSVDIDVDLPTPIISIGVTDLFDSVLISYDRAFKEAIQHLADNGHSKIAFIGEKYTSRSLEWFKNAMEELGLEAKNDYIVTTPQTRFEEAGYEAMNSLLSLKDPPTAIIAAYDYIAFGAIKAITEHGLKIPEDISIIGKNDVKECNYLSLPLTTITAYSSDLCQIVVDALFNKIQNKTTGTPKKIKVSAELVKRGSVGKAPLK